MNKSLTSYIENNIIREYATKTVDGYSLDVSDLDSHEKNNLVDWLFTHDEIIKELILDRAQELIDQRISFVESKDRYNNGYVPSIDKINGEVTWVPLRGAA